MLFLLIQLTTVELEHVWYMVFYIWTYLVLLMLGGDTNNKRVNKIYSQLLVETTAKSGLRFPCDILLLLILLQFF